MADPDGSITKTNDSIKLIGHASRGAPINTLMIVVSLSDLLCSGRQSKRE